MLIVFITLAILWPLCHGYGKEKWGSDFVGIPESTHILEVCDEGSLFEYLQRAFSNEPQVVVLMSRKASKGPCVKHHAPLKEDLSCLIPPPVAITREVTSLSSVDEAEVLEWANKRVHSFRNWKGDLTDVGRYIKDEFKANNLYTISALEPNSMMCDIISKEEAVERFRKDYWYKQRPVVIKDYQSDGPISAESLERVLRSVGKEIVGCKLSDSADFEGVESREQWREEGDDDDIPDVVRQKLAAVNTVVVRAAHKQLSLEEVLSLLAEKKTSGSSMTAYVEYHRLRTSDSAAHRRLLEELLRPETSPSTGETMLEGFIEELFARDGVLNGHPYLWLGDGSTLGKRHFDPYDNLLFQQAGSKTFTLSPPSSFSEGHLREANLKAESNPRKRGNGTATYSVSRGSLVTSTSLVHSIDSVDGRPTMDCLVEAGSVLFVPSFWWHEVQSAPGPEIGVGEKWATTPINVAVNLWFPPLFDKAFPCTECEREFNYAEYADLVQRFVQVDNQMTP